MLNPKWQEAEDERVEAEEEYTKNLRLHQTGKLVGDKWNTAVKKLNAKIEAANQKIREIPENIEDAE